MMLLLYSLICCLVALSAAFSPVVPLRALKQSKVVSLGAEVFANGNVAIEESESVEKESEVPMDAPSDENGNVPEELIFDDTNDEDDEQARIDAERMRLAIDYALHGYVHQLM